MIGPLAANNCLELLLVVAVNWVDIKRVAESYSWMLEAAAIHWPMYRAAVSCLKMLGATVDDRTY